MPPFASATAARTIDRRTPQIGFSPSSFSSKAGERAAEGGERLTGLAFLDVDEAEAGERTEVAGLECQDAIDVGNGAVVLAHQTGLFE